MGLGVILNCDSGDTEKTFADLCARMRLAGWRVVGVIQQAPGGKTSHRCDMDIRVLPDGPLLRLSQPLGSGARGCRLDVGALEMAVAATEAEFARGADLLVINKFGKLEAEGRGFRTLVAEALLQGIPVICGLTVLNQAAFDDYAGSIARYLPNDPGYLEKWLMDAVLQGAA